MGAIDFGSPIHRLYSRYLFTSDAKMMLRLKTFIAFKLGASVLRKNLAVVSQ